MVASSLFLVLFSDLSHNEEAHHVARHARHELRMEGQVSMRATKELEDSHQAKVQQTRERAGSIERRQCKFQYLPLVMFIDSLKEALRVRLSEAEAETRRTELRIETLQSKM
jgi:hypothetical protein